MWLKLTGAGIRLHYFHKPTVGYRQHGRALNNNNWQGVIRPDFKMRHAIRRQFAHPDLPWEIAGKENFRFTTSKLFLFLGLANSSVAIRNLFNFIVNYLNPFTYIHYLKRKLPGRHRQNRFYS